MIVDGQLGHLDKIKLANVGIVYQLIDRYGPISRIELSKKAQLVPASITKIVRELLDGHLIIEHEYQEVASRGRPAIGLMLNTATWHYLAITIRYGSLIFSLHDLSAKVISEETIPLSLNNDLPLLATLTHEIEFFFKRQQDKLERLSAIAITAPGVIDSKQGIIHKMPFYDVTDMPLAEILSEMTGVPVFIQQEVSAWTLAEFYFGAAKNAENAIHIIIDEQISAGVICDGQLLHQNSSRVVEIGHCNVVKQGALCHCGHYGCLETVASTSNIVKLATERAVNYPDSLLNQQLVTIESFCQAVIAGDLLAQQILYEISQYIGQIMAILVNLFKPDLILIGSPLNTIKDKFYPLIELCIEQQAIAANQTSLKLLPCTQANSSSMPAAALIKQALYNGSLLNRLLQG